MRYKWILGFMAVCSIVAGCNGERGKEAESSGKFDLKIQLEGLVAYVENGDSLWALMPNAANDRETDPPSDHHIFPPGVDHNLVRNICPLKYPPHYAVLQTSHGSPGARRALTDIHGYDIRFDLKFADAASEEAAQFRPPNGMPVPMNEVMPEWGRIDPRWIAEDVGANRVLAARVLLAHGQALSTTASVSYRREVMRMVYEDDPYCQRSRLDDGELFRKPPIGMTIEIQGLEEAAVILTPFGGGGMSVKVPLVSNDSGVAEVGLFNKGARHLFLALDKDSHFEDFQYYYNLALKPEGEEASYETLSFLAPAGEGDDRCTKTTFVR